jgi:hypothetical protein
MKGRIGLDKVYIDGANPSFDDKGDFDEKYASYRRKGCCWQ